VSGVLDATARLASPWAYVVLALLAAAESAAFVGLALPGETAMLLGGFLTFQGHASLGWMMAAGALGAVAGDSVGYQIGRALGEPLKRSPLGRKVGEELGQGRGLPVRKGRPRGVPGPPQLVSPHRGPPALSGADRMAPSVGRQPNRPQQR